MTMHHKKICFLVSARHISRQPTETIRNTHLWSCVWSLTLLSLKLRIKNSSNSNKNATVILMDFSVSLLTLQRAIARPTTSKSSTIEHGTAQVGLWHQSVFLIAFTLCTLHPSKSKEYVS